MARKRRKKKGPAADTLETVADTVEESGDIALEASEGSDSVPQDEAPTVEEQIDGDQLLDEESTDTSDVEAEPDKEGQLQKQFEDMKDKYLRTRAEMDNFRKRKVKELEEARRNAKLAAVEEIMPVMDQFQMAVSAIDGAGDLETIKMGMKMIQTTFNRAFENLGIETLACVGETFDPNIHEAVTMEESDDVPADHIIREWKAGYRLGDFLIRPSTVVLSSGVASEDEGDEDVDDGDAEDITDDVAEETAE